MRTLTMVLLAAAATTSCKPKPDAPVAFQPEADTPAPPPAPVGPPMDPIPPIRGLDEALIGLLGLDGRAAPTTVDADATTRFATIGRAGDGEELTIYGFFDGKLNTEHTIALPTGEQTAVRSWVWRTEDELVLLLHDGTLRKVHIDDGKLKPLARPGKKLFAVPKPKDEGLDRFDRDQALIATAGEVWLHHCVWGESGDDDPCSIDVYVQVAPKQKASKTAPVARAPWVHDPAPEWTLSLTPLGDYPTGVLECSGPGGVDVDVTPPENSFGYSLDDAVWLSARPPIQIVQAWFGGADGAVPAARFLARCKTSDAEPTRVEVGPGGFWTLGTKDEADATNDGGALLLWHGRVVGTMRRAEQILFSP